MRRLLQTEAGFSIVPAIAAMALLIMLGGVAVQEAVSALRHANEQESVKRALQAADAAIDVAVFRQNRVDLSGGINIDPTNPGVVLTQNCVVSVGDVTTGFQTQPLSTAVAVDGDGRRWCPATPYEAAGDNAGWSYRVSDVARIGAEDCDANGILSLDREIVAVGKAGAKVRRVRARLRAAVALLSGAAVQSASTTSAMAMAGTASVLGNVQSNGDIIGTATNTIAGTAIPGPGNVVSGVIPANTVAACSEFVLPPINPEDSAVVNHNTKRVDDCVTLLLISTSCTSLVGLSLTTTGGVTYDATQKTLRVWGNGRTVLTGETYSFCRIRLEGSGMLVVKSTTPVTRIFLRDPADCPGVTNAGQIVMDGSSRIVNCHAQTQPESLQLYALGNKTTATTQTLSGLGLLSSTLMATTCGVNIDLVGVPMVVYAPNSRVELGGDFRVAGQVAANTVAMSGSSAVNPINALVNLNQLGGNPVLPLYQPIDYVECTSRTFEELPANDPSQGC